ncbi:MAG: MgtC/SapB family protein [Ignavibacteriales bacterium]|nr:MgtC/SapB family protein [Ignavibacteriales bacterium]
MNTFEWTFELRFTVALALGLLIGLERESASSDRKFQYFAGVRTYTLISLYGFGCAWLYHINVALALPIGMISVTALAVVGYLAKLKDGRIGSTSEVVALVTFIIGALTVLADVWVAMSLGIISTILLSEKADLDNFVEKLDKSEFLAVLKFLLVTVIILPVLPNQEYTQFKLNPTRVWQIVIMVSTIGFIGYFLIKKFGSKVGLWLSGLLGGIASSTAVTVATARIAKKSPEKCGDALQASILASSVMYLRILVLIWLINPIFVSHLWWKMVILSIVGAAMVVRIKSKHIATENSEVTSIQNPFEIRPAMMFGIFFVGLSVITILTNKLFGSTGLIALSAITGVTDIDPFILSLVQQSTSVENIFVSAILMAAMSNTIMKGIYFTLISKQLRHEATIRYGIWALAHLPLIFIA